VTTPSLPDSHRDLLEGPHFGVLSTVRPDGSPQGSVMWFAWDGELLRFTHKTNRQKYRNVQHEPRVSLSVMDPEKPYRFLEVRGRVESITPDPTGAFYAELQGRYGVSSPLYDAAARVIVAVRPTHFVTVDNGMTPREQETMRAFLARGSDDPA
jgi:PPOX class probable F420-dependent enzyme